MFEENRTFRTFVETEMCTLMWSDSPVHWPPSSVLPGTTPPRCLRTTARTRRSPSLRPSPSRPSEDAAPRWTELKKEKTWLNGPACICLTADPRFVSCQKVCEAAESRVAAPPIRVQPLTLDKVKASKINSGPDWLKRQRHSTLSAGGNR